MEKVGKTGLIFDPRLFKHKSHRKHPERPERVQSIIRMLTQQYYTTHPKVEFVSQIDREATDEQLKLAHKPKYIKHISSLWPEVSHRSDMMILDTYFNEYSHQCSRIAVAGVLEGIQRIVNGDWQNGFVAVRPPGHHSGGRNTINGFCIFNNVAIGAKYLISKHKRKKVAIVDWDVHHGDGTQSILQDNKDVLLISVHRYDRSTFYPASEDASVGNMGSGWAVGTKVNIPLDFVDEKFKEYKFQSPGDNEYIYIYHRIVEPILRQFDPDFILVSSGFDAARGDPLGGFTITPNGYYYMTSKMLELEKPLLMVLEGGYNLQAISLSASAVMKALLKEQGLPQPSTCKLEPRKLQSSCQIEAAMHNQIDQIVQALRAEWKCLDSEALKSYTDFVKKNQVRQFGVVEPLSSSSSTSEESEHDEVNQKYQRELLGASEFRAKSLKAPKIDKQPAISQNEKLRHQAKAREVKSANDKKQPLKKENCIEQAKDAFADSGKDMGSLYEEKEADKCHVTSQFYFAAGHLQRFKNFSPNNDKLYKKTYESEIQFYETMSLEREFTPKYFGREGDYIILENVLYQQIDPVVIDIKISKLSESPFISPDRIPAEKKKEMKSSTAKYCFKVSGYTTPVYKEGGLTVKSEQSINQILRYAITQENRQPFCDFLARMSKTLQKLHRNYYSTSILIIKGSSKSDIKWIDFRYYTDSECPDQNMISGINNLRRFIDELQLKE